MTVKEFQQQLALAKNKDAKVVFKSGSTIIDDVNMLTEAVSDGGNVRYPHLGEKSNAIVVVLGKTEPKTPASE